MHLRWRLRCGSENPVQAESSRESATRRLEVNVAGTRLIRIADKEIDVSDDGRLVREIAHVCGKIIFGAVDALELHEAIGRRRETLDEPLNLLGRVLLGHCWPLVRERDVVERVVEECVGRYGDDNVAVLGDAEGAYAVVDQVLA
jgi:hypothetical protein